MSMVTASVLVLAVSTLLATSIIITSRKRNESKKKVAEGGLLELVGNTPLVLIPSLSKLTDCHIYAKCEFMNPCGSSKDRVAKEILLEAIENGRLKPGGTVVEASSGSTGISLTRLARALGYSSLIVVPNDQAKEKVQLLRKLGAVVELVKPASIVNPEHNVNIAQKAAMKIENGFFADQFENEANVRAHLKTGNEIWEQTGGNIDAFVTSAGTAGTIAGVSQVLKGNDPKVKVYLADPQGSSLYNAIKHGVLYAPEQQEQTMRRHRIDTIVEGVGLDRKTTNFKLAIPYIDDAYRISDSEVVSMSRKLLLEDGFFVGSSSCLNCAAAVKVAQELGPGHVIVTVFCSSGEREASKLYDDEFCASRGLL